MTTHKVDTDVIDKEVMDALQKRRHDLEKEACIREMMGVPTNGIRAENTAIVPDDAVKITATTINKNSDRLTKSHPQSKWITIDGLEDNDDHD